MLPGPDERLLGDVLGGAVVVDDRAGETEDPALEPLDERRSGITVAGGEAGDQGIVRNGPHEVLRRRGPRDCTEITVKYGRGAVLTIDLTNRCNMMSIRVSWTQTKLDLYTS